MESGLVKKRNKFVGSGINIFDETVVSDLRSTSLPDVFLRILIRSISWKMNNLDFFVFMNKILNDRAFVPTCMVPKKNNFPGGINGSDFFQNISGDMHRLKFCFESMNLACSHV